MSDVSMKATATFTPRGDMRQFIATRITPGVRASVNAACQLVATEAKANAPVKTGQLRDSIGYKVEDGERTVIGRIYASAPYAGYVEYGTGQRGAMSADLGPYPYSPTWPGQSAQPFLRPALETSRSAIKEIFASQIAVSLKT